MEALRNRSTQSAQGIFHAMVDLGCSDADSEKQLPQTQRAMSLSSCSVAQICNLLGLLP